MHYKYQDAIHCRWWGISDETLVHIVNCGVNGHNIENVAEIIRGVHLQLMKDLAMRVENFLERVEI